MSDNQYLKPCTDCDGEARAIFIAFGIFPAARYECTACGVRFSRMLTLEEADIVANEIEKTEGGAV